MQLFLLEDRFAICRLPFQQDVPAWAWLDKQLVSVTYTADELSIVCVARNVPADVPCEKGWAAIKVQGPLDFSLTGILAGLIQPLAENKISIFALSTFDTDYILLKEAQLEQAKALLEQHGHVFES